MENKPIIAIIGGSGLYDLDGIKISKLKHVKTPYGDPSDKVVVSKYKNLEILFLPRHGKKHTHAPHKINYRANIFALKKLGATDIISVSAVGSLKKIHKPGDFILVDQFIDRTINRERTFFDGNLVSHVSIAEPTSKELSKLIYNSKKNNNDRIKLGGTYICIEGPQFSTYAESILFKSWNCDVIGMTNMPEARLAREAEMGYSSIAMVTDYDCWNKSHAQVTVEQVLRIMKSNTTKAKSLLISIFEKIAKIQSWNWKNPIYSNLDNALITNLKYVDKKVLIKLKPLLKRYLNK
ncbi:S-methyl-5'-thioadenosine phosphorylase [Alphaproteobacteria bacterium]|nr:S-methyl-5'-thioadenosine phosphorylase [Alphaproteobacteria bacterium]